MILSSVTFAPEGTLHSILDYLLRKLPGENGKMADIIVMAIGKAKFLKKEMIKNGAIIVDVGINFENGKMCGDVDFEDVKDKAYAITPVPGGIGVVTNALLIDNIINSAKRD